MGHLKNLYQILPFTSSPECFRDLRVVFLHYQMYSEKFFLITILS